MPFFIRAIFANSISRVLFIIQMLMLLVVTITQLRPEMLLASGYKKDVPYILVFTCSIFTIYIIAFTFALVAWTRDFYNQSVKHIEKHKRIDSRFVEVMDAPCKRAGLRLAAKDMNCPIEIS